jgi:hypothetical protein
MLNTIRDFFSGGITGGRPMAHPPDSDADHALITGLPESLKRDNPVYVDELPVWDGMDYLDPTTREPLQTWASALAQLDLDEDAQPAHVIRFGRQIDVQGLLAGTPTQIGPSATSPSI